VLEGVREARSGAFVWFIPLFWQHTVVAQFFHDQLAAFLSDHVKDPADSGNVEGVMSARMQER
jgi:hypothetical protein